MPYAKITIIAVIALITLSGFCINLIKKARAKEAVVLDDGRRFSLFRLIIPVSLFSAFTAYWLGIGHTAATVYCFTGGLVLVAAGLVFRWIAVLSLGNAFTVQVAIVTDHTLKTDGLYKYIRNPSYAGMLVYYLGLGIAMSNWISIVLLIAGPWWVVLNRIKKEEAVLRTHFGAAYEQYKARTWRLIPMVF